VFRQWTLGCTIERQGSPIRRARSISKIAAWWLPGLSKKGQKETAAAGCWKGGRHPDTINGRFSHLVAVLEGNWWEKGRVGQQDGFS